jgi:hypothetical protein
MAFAAKTTHASDRRVQHSTRIAFFIAGFAGSSWAAMVPFVKARVGLGDGELGLLLLCLGVGSIGAMPIAGALAARAGCRFAIIVAVTAVSMTLPILATSTSTPCLIMALLSLGAGLGSIDCVANIQAVIVEHAIGRPIMSSFHSFFSMGGIMGAGCASVALSLGATPLSTELMASAVALAALIAALSGLLTEGTAQGGPLFAIPKGSVLLVGMLCFIAFLTEGAILDWSAVFLTSIRGLAPSLAGAGYAAFALTMTIGRLTGDLIIRWLGGRTVVLGGAVCASAGLSITTLLPSWQASIFGYALVGLGCSNIVPVLYSAIGRQTVMPRHVAIAAITTFGYTGGLLGPVVIGLVAGLSSLLVAFNLLALCILVVAAGGPALARLLPSR